MYAVIETGGKQYRVELGSELAVERLEGAPGDTISFDRVLLVADGGEAQIGTPVVTDALVTASVLRQDRGDKVIVFKYRPKARHRAKKGHRQEQTVLRVADIRFNGRSAADEASVQQKEESKARQSAAAEAERKAAADQALAAKLEKEAAEREEQAKAAEAKSEPKATKAKTAPKKAADKPTGQSEPAPDKPKTARAKAAPKTASEAASSKTSKAAAAKKTTTRAKTTRSTKKDA